MEKEYILSLSYGKDSLACLEACKRLGIKIDRVVHAEVWATDDIPADLPPMVEFKEKADKIIKDRYGLEVEHVWASKKKGGAKASYSTFFYTETKKGKYIGKIYGFPCAIKPWCNSKLKVDIVQNYLRKKVLPLQQGEATDIRVPDEKRELLYRIENNSYP